MPGVGNQNVDCDGGLHEGIRLHLSQFYLGGTQILHCRSRMRQPPGENLQRSEGVSTDRRRERKFRNKEIRCPACCSTRYCSTHYVKTIPPNTENWLRKLYDKNCNNDTSTEDKHETNYSMNNDRRNMHIT